MAEGRRRRAATEEKRERILDATEEIMLKEGYAAVSSRSVATAVGIQAPLVHYYFSTIDDLFVVGISLAISAILLCLAAWPPHPALLLTRDVLTWLSVALTLYSGLVYIAVALPMLRGDAPPH